MTCVTMKPSCRTPTWSTGWWELLVSWKREREGGRERETEKWFCLMLYIPMSPSVPEMEDIIYLATRGLVGGRGASFLRVYLCHWVCYGWGEGGGGSGSNNLFLGCTGVSGCAWNGGYMCCLRVGEEVTRFWGCTFAAWRLVRRWLLFEGVPLVELIVLCLFTLYAKW